MDAAEHQSPSVPAQGTARFLIVDDTPGKQHYLRALLKKSRFPAEVVVAHSTKEGEDLIVKTQAIVGAFIDFRMPETGGIPLISMLRKHHPNAHIALVTASTGDVLEQEAHAAGADVAISTAYPERFVTEKILTLLRQWKEMQAVR